MMARMKKTQVIIFFEINLFLKLNLKKTHRFSSLVSSLFIVRFEKFQMILTPKSLCSNYINISTGLAQKQKCFSNMKFVVFTKLKNHYSGLTAGTPV